MHGKKQWIAAGLLALLLCAFCLPGLSEEYRELKQGMNGEDIQRFKVAMYWLGYFTTPNLDGNYTKTTAERVRQLQKNNGLEETGIADAALQELVFSGNAVKTKTAPSPSPVPTPAPTPVPVLPLNELLDTLPASTPPPLAENNFLAENAETDEFVYADADRGLWIYLTPELSIDVRRYEDTSVKKYPIVWYEADIRCSPETPLTAYTSGVKRPGTALINPLTFARKNHIVLAFSDDHFGYRIVENDKGIPPGIVIREGQILSTKTRTKKTLPNLDILAVFEDGSMKTFAPQEYTAEEYLAMGVRSTYSFGPALISNGELTEYMLRDYYAYHEPRMALGMIEPYHYMVLCVEGRMDNRSKGVYLNWLANKMLEKGVTEALNLDGGGTACLMFMGERINKTANSIRPVGSITGFGTSDLVPEK